MMNPARDVAVGLRLRNLWPVMSRMNIDLFATDYVHCRLNR